MRTTTRARLALALTAAAMVLAVLPVGASAGSGKPSGPSGGGTVTWDGAGSVSDGKDGLVPADSECEDDDDDASGPYLDFELENARYVTSATIAFGKDDPVVMHGHDGHFGYHYTADSIDLAAILDDGVTVTYTSRKRVSPRLVLDEGCVESAGITITVVYLGSQPGTGSAFGDLGWFVSSLLPQVVSVCETAAPANCVALATGTTPGTSGSITLAGPGTLDLTSGGTNQCGAALFGASFAFGATPPSPAEAQAFNSTGATTAPETVSRTVYVATFCGG